MNIIYFISKRNIPSLHFITDGGVYCLENDEEQVYWFSAAFQEQNNYRVLEFTEEVKKLNVGINSARCIWDELVKGHNFKRVY